MKNEGRISEANLFEFVKVTSLRSLVMPAEPTQLLKKNEYEPDIFLNIFAAEFFKTMKMLAAKRVLRNDSFTSSAVRQVSKIVRTSTKNVLLGEDRVKRYGDHRGKHESPAKTASIGNSLTLADFNDTDRPDIIFHIIKTMTGVDLANKPEPIAEKVGTYILEQRVMPAKVNH